MCQPVLGPLRLHPVHLLRVLSRRQLKVAGGSGLASARLICTGHGRVMYLLVSQVLWSRALPLSGRSWAKNWPNYAFRLCAYSCEYRISSGVNSSWFPPHAARMLPTCAGLSAGSTLTGRRHR